MRPYASWVKRPLDLFLGVTALLVLFPILALIGILVRLDSAGAILFTQTRIGRFGNPFTMYKFRTMRVNAPDLRHDDGTTYNAFDDPRVTTLGRMLRATSLDELPQLLNVIRGEMSLVGGRPDLPEGVAGYTGSQADRLLVRPGLTSWAIVHGRNNVPLQTRRDLDAWYAQHVTLMLDLRIIIRTVQLVVRREGVINEYSKHPGASS
jgi:lipopolysaccharide/colanic/teichoic acid biosynthesis glycosyltransferase